ncbi:hypothetical protein BKA70DRAFT_1216178 [Coprinopsis sp. MPI-PUGE-AT-0042]|nr:hypothetical protein BKA70DRAFT_1216178 [Coprinopsis sp. MPI-PUGE-AT-0042]
MAPTPPAKKQATKKKEKIFHPSSRKAGQLVRKSIRKERLQNQASKRKEKHGVEADFYGFFYHALPEDGVLSLEELHGVVRDVWLARHDQDLEEERAARRKGRAKSTRETQLEDTKLLESELYRTGIEVIDLTHGPTVDLFRRWDQKEVAYIDLLRFIRIFRDEPSRFVVSKPGKHVSIVNAAKQDEDSTMAVDASAS